MSLTRCSQGHYYDPASHNTCPHCPVPGVDLGELGGTLPVKKDTPPGPAKGASSGDGGTRPVGLPAAGDDSGRTVGVVQDRLGIDPVVGWLVCIEGPDRGRDYRIRSGRNFIGRADHMHICVRGDTSISREKHAAISYDPKHRVFKALPGDSAELSYVNNETLDVPTQLEARDILELGHSKLLFVPLCGSDFEWREVDGEDE